jgi:type I restriction enzyme S subunit
MDRGVVRRNDIDRKMAPDVPADQSLLVEPGDLAYNMMRMWQGAVGVCNETGVVSPAYVVCRPRKSRADVYFMYHLFKSHPGRHRLTAYSYGVHGDRLRLYYPDFALVPAPLPPLHEQRKIANILSTWDAAIEHTGTLIASAKRRKTGLMQQLLTANKRLPPHRKQWETRLLGDLFREREETNYPGLPLLAITAGQGIVPAAELNRRDASNEDKTAYRRICPGDLGYNTMRMWQGVSAVSRLEGIVSPAYTICTPRAGVCVEFIACLLKYHPTVHILWRHSQGLVDDTLSLKYHHFARIKVVIPDEAEQRAIAVVLTAADDELRLLEARCAALERQKQGLMQRLLTGEIRVRD